LGRDEKEVSALLEIIADAVASLAETRRWPLQMVGDLSLLPEPIADRLRAAEELTSGISGMHINIAVGYGGRHEIVGAVRDLLQEGLTHGVASDDLAGL